MTSGIDKNSQESTYIVNAESAAEMNRLTIQDAGCQNIRHASFAIDFSAGGESKGYMYENAQLGFLLITPFILKLHPTLSKEDLAQLTQQTMKDMDSPDFRAIWYYLSVWGNKSE